MLLSKKGGGVWFLFLAVWWWWGFFPQQIEQITNCIINNISLHVIVDFRKLQDHDLRIVLFLQVTCLMPDTSSYLISCRSSLRARGVAASFAAFFRDNEFLKHIYRISQVYQDLWLLVSVTLASVLFWFIFLQKDLPRCKEFTEMMQHPHCCMADLYGKQSLALSKLCALLFWKISVVLVLSKWQNLLFRLSKIIQVVLLITLFIFFLSCPSWRKEGTCHSVTLFVMFLGSVPFPFFFYVVS